MWSFENTAEQNYSDCLWLPTSLAIYAKESLWNAATCKPRSLFMHGGLLITNYSHSCSQRKGRRDSLHLTLKRSPEPLWDPGWEPGWDPELLDPEELPLPGLGTSFSTLSHRRRGSILLLEKRREQCHSSTLWRKCVHDVGRGEERKTYKQHLTHSVTEAREILSVCEAWDTYTQSRATTTAVLIRDPILDWT